LLAGQRIVGPPLAFPIRKTGSVASATELPTTSVLGIHHVTAIAGDPRRNLDFYAGVLGLRLVKRTVNYDDPHTYHFYFGDEVGRPGSLLTFFPWPGARRGRQGVGQVATMALAVAPRALGFWLERLLHSGVAHQGPTRRGAESVISLRDPDGALLEIVATAGAEARPGWGGASGIGLEDAIRGVHAVTLWVEESEPTERVLHRLGFRPAGEPVAGTRRFAAGDGGPGTLLDVRAVGGFPRGVESAGAVHHVAFRVADEAAQLEVRREVVAAGLYPTAVIDRSYFRSVYFREPGGVLFELATEGPGFAIDEPVGELGRRLTLPPRLERSRAEIEAALPPLA
jgi:glyoxalase family protein